MAPKSFEIGVMSHVYVHLMKWILVAFSILVLNWCVLMLHCKCAGLELYLIENT